MGVVKFNIKKIDGVEYRTIPEHDVACDNCVAHGNRMLCIKLGLWCTDNDVVWIKRHEDS